MHEEKKSVKYLAGIKFSQISLPDKSENTN